MADGDLWAFLHAVDDDYKRYESEAEQERAREDDMAVAFVERVLKHRDGDHDRAWDRFDAALARGAEGGDGAATDATSYAARARRARERRASKPPESACLLYTSPSPRNRG